MFGIYEFPIFIAHLRGRRHDFRGIGTYFGSTGTKPTPEFVADTLDTIQNFHNLLRTIVGDEADAIDKGSPAPKRFIVDGNLTFGI